MFNDELATLRYRLALHASFVSKFIVVESNLTWSALPKPLHATNGLSAAEKRQYNVTIVQVPFSPELRVGSGRKRLPNRVRESAQREFLNLYLQQNYPQHVVYVSDVDEFLDADAVRTSLALDDRNPTPSLRTAPCVAPLYRLYYYSEACPVSQMWKPAVVFRTSSHWFEAVVKSKRQLRMFADASTPRAMRCAIPKDSFFTYHGWHLSWALDTPTILSKVGRARSNARPPPCARLRRATPCTHPLCTSRCPGRCARSRAPTSWSRSCGSTGCRLTSGRRSSSRV
jgi:hypothetical protein